MRYDTNLRMSYSAGSWAQVERTKKDLPYLRYWDPDPNPRPQHLDWSGTVLPADDPWWDTHYPPNGWHCKCLADSLSESDLSRYGYERSATAPPSPTYTYENPRTGEVSHAPVGIDPGFAYNPGKAGIRFAAEKDLAEKMATAEPDIRRAVHAIKPPEDRGEPIGRASDAKIERILKGRPRALEVMRRATPEEWSAGWNYCEDSDRINLPWQRGEITPEARALLRLMKKLPKYQGVVWRGEEWMSLDEAQAYYRLGAQIRSRAFYSTSRSRERAMRFNRRGGVLLRFRTRRGRDVSMFSPFPQQEEILFAPGLRLRVKSVKEKGPFLYVSLDEE